jgi:hypothetical protein
MGENSPTLVTLISDEWQTTEANYLPGFLPKMQSSLKNIKFFNSTTKILHM